jgi:hypothetical protein
MLDTVRTALEGRLAAVQADIALLEASMADVTQNGISSMELDTGEARQKVVLKNVEGVNRTLEALYATQAWLLRRLGGGGIVSVHRRRKS